MSPSILEVATISTSPGDVLIGVGLRPHADIFGPIDMSPNAIFSRPPVVGFKTLVDYL